MLISHNANPNPPMYLKSLLGISLSYSQYPTQGLHLTDAIFYTIGTSQRFYVQTYHLSFAFRHGTECNDWKYDTLGHAVLNEADLTL